VRIDVGVGEETDDRNSFSPKLGYHIAVKVFGRNDSDRCSSQTVDGDRKTGNGGEKERKGEKRPDHEKLLEMVLILRIKY
jgi:hypothetical protein